MVDRFLVWLGAGIVTAGVSAALLAGAGVASASDGTSSNDGGNETSESSDSVGNKGDSGAGQVPADKDEADKDEDEDAKDKDAKTEAKDEDATQAIPDEDAIDETTDTDVIDDDASETHDEADEIVETIEKTGTGTGLSSDAGHDESQTLQPDQTVVDDLDVSAKTNLEDVENKDALPSTEPEPGEEHAMVPLAAGLEELTEQTETAEFAAVMFSAPAAAPVDAVAAATPLNILLDVVGTIVFGLFSLVTQLIGGPPTVPPGSVTVLSSRLRIDCGCAPGAGKEVPVDWYIPENPDPERLIYLQHGFLAAAPWYSYTAAALAEETNSIVVAPSITSNFLAYDQCWLGGAPMHQAMADLFDPNNWALEDSAIAAGYDDLRWDEVVLMGHSLGGGAVSGIAGWMTENGNADRLAGVVLLDGVGFNGRMADDLSNVPDDIPIYQLAAPKYIWNMFGNGTAALLQARPGVDFYGVTLAGGSHVDTMRSGSFLIQFAQQLAAGFSTPQNVAAASMVMVGWVNDMFAGNRNTGIYLANGETRTVDTSAGPATLVDLPNSLRRPDILNFLEPFTAFSSGLFNLQPGCLRESTRTAPSCAGSVAI